VAVPDGSLFNRQIGQPTLTIMAGEADGVVPQLDPLAHLFGVSGSSGGDFDSLTHKPGSPRARRQHPGLDISYQTVRRWVSKFGPIFAQELRRRRPRSISRCHLDEMAVMK